MKEITTAQFDAEVLQSQVPVLIDFYTESCPPCRMMSPILADIEQGSDGAYTIVKVDAAADSQLAASFKISAVPTFVLFHRGQRIGQITGARSRKEMQKWITESIAAAP
jgi:thioredoxin